MDLRVPPTYTSGSSQNIPPQCTPPYRANNTLLVFQRSSGLPEAEGGHFLIPAQNQLCLPPHCFRQGIRYVYSSQYPTPYLLPYVRCDGFPSQEELRQVPYCTVIYSNPVSCVCVYLVSILNDDSVLVAYPHPLALPSFSMLHGEKWESLVSEVTCVM